MLLMPIQFPTKYLTVESVAYIRTANIYSSDTSSDYFEFYYTVSNLYFEKIISYIVGEMSLLIIYKFKKTISYNKQKFSYSERTF